MDYEAITCQICGKSIEGGFDEAVELTVSDFAHDYHSPADIAQWTEDVQS